MAVYVSLHHRRGIPLFSFASLGATLSAVGLAGTLNNPGLLASGGLDLAGLAAVIASITGLISSVGALILAFSRNKHDEAKPQVVVIHDDHQEASE